MFPKQIHTMIIFLKLAVQILFNYFNFSQITFPLSFTFSHYSLPYSHLGIRFTVMHNHSMNFPLACQLLIADWSLTLNKAFVLRDTYVNNEHGWLFLIKPSVGMRLVPPCDYVNIGGCEGHFLIWLFLKQGQDLILYLKRFVLFCCAYIFWILLFPSFTRLRWRELSRSRWLISSLRMNLFNLLPGVSWRRIITRIVFRSGWFPGYGKIRRNSLIETKPRKYENVRIDINNIW